ncbi:unnamed protein product (macronuclear) [Paramecium tetraurelia]|uniref:Uncharacterized protein n=1 Tax=Paramecium tetraurelia TaxID=5888 RepID=A0BVS0_PARTE|nr:uncharacterized protein GSPATT00032489001 [Paramecium tetraurelia]CAK62637.1 unnamed protein product [Paramecium tetraurelia]|eukprot:XP_001430035.1 hypothetical protein (macronuclear) [Paramecium tetraurelia strain d4-2]
MKTKPKISTQPTSAKKLTSLLPSDSLKASQIQELIHDDQTSWESRFQSTIIEYSFTKFMNPNKLTKYAMQENKPKRGIPDTSREQGAKLKKSYTNSTLISSPRMMSPKEQVEVIHYLEFKNKTLIEENKRKTNLIAKLLHTKSPSKSNNIPQQPPKSAELYSPSTRFPLITTPQTNEIQVPSNSKLNQPKVTRIDQNWSFGKLSEEDRDAKIKSQFSRITNATHQKSSIKTNFQKPLLKLPKEFHPQSWNSIKK